MTPGRPVEEGVQTDIVITLNNVPVRDDGARNGCWEKQFSYRTVVDQPTAIIHLTPAVERLLSTAKTLPGLCIAFYPLPI